MSMMSDCRWTAERLTAYVDRLLSPEEQQDVDRHVSACPPCRDAAAAESGGRAVLRERAEALTAEPLPPGLRTRCEALAREHTRLPDAVPAWRRLMPVSLTAVFVLFAAIAVLSVATYRFDTVLAAQVAADHAKCFRLFAGGEEADARRLEQMLADEYGWDVHVPPSSPADGVQLIGARRCLYADGPIPHVMYLVDGQNVSLYMLDDVTRDAATVEALGHRSRIWSREGRTYVLVSHASAGDLTAAARYLMQEAQ